MEGVAAKGSWHHVQHRGKEVRRMGRGHEDIPQRTPCRRLLCMKGAVFETVVRPGSGRGVFIPDELRTSLGRLIVIDSSHVNITGICMRTTHVGNIRHGNSIKYYIEYDTFLIFLIIRLIIIINSKLLKTLAILNIRSPQRWTV